MAAPKSGLSFDDIIKNSRQKKANEKFAQSIFGRDRRSSAPGALGKRKSDAIPSLASRVGVKKPLTQRHKAIRDSHLKHNPYITKGSPLNKEMFGGAFAERDDKAPPTKPKGQNISIRGLAGPAVVMGSNFAPGTTAADIQSAMEPVGGQMQSCRVVTARPTVIAEMVFADRAGAEAVIETFNNQKADGRLLHIYLKTGPGGQNIPAPSPAPVVDPGFEQQALTAKLQSQNQPQPQSQSIRLDTGDKYEQPAYDGPRAEPEYQDGSYGFDEGKQEMDVDMDAQREDRDGRLYESDRRDVRHDDRRDERRDGRRDARPYQPPNGRDRRYDNGPRDNRLYSDRMGYRGGRGYR